MYTVYVTTNLMNGRFYVGVHKTSNLHDEYLGSGKILKAAVRKHGPTTFCKIILFVTDIAREAFDKERSLIAATAGDPLCMNLHEGGSGGFEYIVKNGLQLKGALIGAKAISDRHKTDPDFHARIIQRLSNTRKNPSAEHIANMLKAAMKSRRERPPVWTVAARQECSRRVSGPGNPSFGKAWICNANEVRRIDTRLLPEFLATGWQRGKRFSPPRWKPVRKRDIHGTVPCYRYGCRCDDCTTTYRRVYRDIMRQRVLDKSSVPRP